MASQTRDILTQIFFIIGLFALTSIVASGTSEGLTAYVNNTPTHNLDRQADLGHKRGLAQAEPLSIDVH